MSASPCYGSQSTIRDSSTWSAGTSDVRGVFLRVLRTKKAAEAAFREAFRSLFASGVFGVAEGFVRRTLGLVELAFDLHFLVARHLAERVLDSALCLIGRAFDMFLVHDRLL